MTPGAISVVIPAFNAERFLAEAIESVLAQGPAPAEVVVVDDGSEDRTAEVAGAFPEVLLLRQANAGVAAARNRGIAAGGGELVALQDADDVSLPGRFRIQAAHLEANPGDGAVVGEQELMVEEGATVPYWEGERSDVRTVEIARPEGEPAGVVQPCTLMLRRRVFDDVGTFDERLRQAEDIDWLFRLREAGYGIGRLEQAVVRRRVHSGSLTQDPAEAREALFRAFKARIARQRAGS